MTALLSDRKFMVPRWVKRDKRPLKAGVKAIKGGIAVCKNGFYQPASATSAARTVGRFLETVDNTGGADGAASAEVEFTTDRALLGFFNKPGDLLSESDRETLAYIEDDQTVRKTAAGTSAAGIIYDIEGSIVFVEVGVFQ
jgi:hypothetical protein